MKTVRQVISGNAGLSLNNVVFVSDRGYSDAKNIKDCLRNKLGFLFNVQCESPEVLLKNSLMRKEKTSGT